MKVVLISKAMLVNSTHSKAELLGKEVDLTLITPKSWPYYVKEELATPRNFKHIKLDISFEGRNHFHFYWKLKSTLKELQPDIIHIDEEPYSFVTFQILRVAKSLKVKSLCFTWQNIYKKYPFPFYQLEQYVYKHSDYIIAGNQEAVNVLRQKGYSKAVKVIPQFGVDTNSFVPGVRQSAAADDNFKLHLGYVGRIVEEKGLSTVMAALVNLPEVRFSLVGNGPYQSTLEQIVHNHRLEKQVYFLGGKSSVEVAKFIATFDALILPSLTKPNWKEQFGRVLPEAMLSRVAVIGSDSGEIPNVIDDAGLVFEEGNIEDCAKNISKLLDPHVLDSLQVKGYERATKLYTQESIVKQTLKVYQELA